MTAESRGEPLVRAMDLDITKVGVIVHDVVQSAKRYAELYGLGPWSFYDIEPSLSVFKAKPTDGDTCGIRLAVADLGEKRLELVQPLYGPSCPMAYLWERGEGIHHLGLSTPGDYNDLLANLRDSGVPIETEGEVDGHGRFVQFGSWQAFGVLFEISEAGLDLPRPWGSYEPRGSGVIGTDGKTIAQIGIVTGDVEVMAKRYWDLLRIGPWQLFDWYPPVGEAKVLHGVQVHPRVDCRIRAAITDHPSIQFELLEPVSGPSTHMEYRRSHGSGSHHLSFDVVEDHDEAVSALEAAGIEIEMQGMAGPAYQYTYMATQRDLGTVWELVKFFPGEDVDAGTYGFYPPQQDTG